MEIKRFTLSHIKPAKHLPVCPVMKPETNGEYILYEDHLKAMQDIRNACVNKIKSLDEYDSEKHSELDLMDMGDVLNIIFSLIKDKS